MEANAIITLGLGVGTILASGITSTVVTYRLNRRKDQFEFMRTKAEALYLAADEFGRMLGSYTITYYPIIKGHCDGNQMLDHHIKMGADKRQYGGAETMTMLVELYFPTVRRSLAAVFAARDSFNSFTAEMKGFYVRDGGLDPRAWLPRMNEETEAISASIKELQAMIVSAARAYASVRHS